MVEATGPLAPDEVEAAIGRLDESSIEAYRACVLEEALKGAARAGNPETLDPATVEFLSNVSRETWRGLDTFGRRLFLAQAISIAATFRCVSA